MWTEQRFNLTEVIGAPSTGVIGSEIIIKLNDPWTPNLAGGNTTYGFTTMSQLYERYIVDAVGIDIEFSDPSADGMMCFAMVQRAQGSLSLAGLDNFEAMNQPGCFSGMLNNTGGQTCRAVQQLSIHEIEGLTKTQVLDEMEQYGGTTAGSPPRRPYLRVGVSNLAGVESTCTVIFRIVYRTKFYSRKENIS